MGRTPTTRGAGAVSGGDLQRLLLHESSVCKFPPVVTRAELRRPIESPESPLRHHQYPPDQRRRVRDLLEPLRRVRPQAHRREGDSITFVRKCFQCPSGNVSKVTIRSQSFTRIATAFGYVRPYAFAKASRRRSASARVGAYGSAVSNSRALGCTRGGADRAR